VALRQHLIGCCNTIREELTHRQQAIVKDLTGPTLWYWSAWLADSCGCHASSEDMPVWQKQSMQSHVAAGCFYPTLRVNAVLQ
jgi:hypothetical protein